MIHRAAFSPCASRIAGWFQIIRCQCNVGLIRRKCLNVVVPVADYAAPYEYYWVPLHEAAVGKQDWRGAARILEGSFRYEPDEVKNLSPGRTCQTDEEAQLASFYSNLHDALAKDLKQAGDISGAGREANRALELANAARARTRA